MKKVFSAMLASLLAVILFAGCTLTEADDGNVVIAKVNGVSILKSKYNEIYNYYYYYYTSMGYDASTAKSTLDQNKTDILDQLVEEELMRQKAEAAGALNYTDAQREEAKKAIDDEKQSYMDNLVEQYKTAFEGQAIKGKKDGESDEDYFKRVAEEKYYKNLEDNGYTEEKLLEEQLLSVALQDYKDDLLKDVAVVESDIISKYDSMYNEQLEALSSDSEFVSAWNSSKYAPFVYYRPGYSLVQHILIPYSEEEAKQLGEYYTKIDEYKTSIEEYQSAYESETDETKKAENKASKEEAEKSLAEVQAKYDELLKTAKSKVQADADSVYKSVKGADEEKFISVMLEKSTDTGMNSEEKAKKGYLVGPEDNMVPEFSKAATALNQGEISEPVATYYGFHIIRCIKKLPEGKAALDDVKAEIEETLVSEKKNTQWTTMLNDWKNESKVKKYENKL